MDTKARDQTTFGDVLVKYITQKNPELLNFDEELMHLEVASKRMQYEIVIYHQ